MALFEEQNNFQQIQVVLYNQEICTTSEVNC